MLRKATFLPAVLIVLAGCCAIEKTAVDANLESGRLIVEDTLDFMERAPDVTDAERASVEAHAESFIDHAEKLVEAVE